MHACASKSWRTSSKAYPPVNRRCRPLAPVSLASAPALIPLCLLALRLSPPRLRPNFQSPIVTNTSCSSSFKKLGYSTKSSGFASIGAGVAVEDEGWRGRMRGERAWRVSAGGRAVVERRCLSMRRGFILYAVERYSYFIPWINKSPFLIELQNVLYINKLF